MKDTRSPVFLFASFQHCIVAQKPPITRTIVMRAIKSSLPSSILMGDYWQIPSAAETVAAISVGRRVNSLPRIGYVGSRSPSPPRWSGIQCRTPFCNCTRFSHFLLHTLQNRPDSGKSTQNASRFTFHRKTLGLNTSTCSRMAGLRFGGEQRHAKNQRRNPPSKNVESVSWMPEPLQLPFIYHTVQIIMATTEKILKNTVNNK